MSQQLALRSEDCEFLLSSLQNLQQGDTKSQPAASMGPLPFPADWVLTRLTRLIRSIISPVEKGASTCSGDIDAALCVDLTWEHLHSSPWKEVPIFWRTLHSSACILQSVECFNRREVKTAHKMLDMAAMMGGPVHERVISHLFLDMAQLSAKRKVTSLQTGDGNGSARTRKKTESPREECKVPTLIRPATIIDAPTMVDFLNNVMKRGRPVILRGACRHWPAFTKWNDYDYLNKVAGHRTVPVEIGRSYTSDNWTQKLMTFEEFLRTHLQWNAKSEARQSPPESAASKPPGYLAQHRLFEQIPELRRDIMTPDYCALSLAGSCEKELHGEVRECYITSLHVIRSLITCLWLWVVCRF